MHTLRSFPQNVVLDSCQQDSGGVQTYAQDHQLLKASTALPAHARLHGLVLLAMLMVKPHVCTTMLAICLDMLEPSKHSQVSCVRLLLLKAYLLLPCPLPTLVNSGPYMWWSYLFL